MKRFADHSHAIKKISILSIFIFLAAFSLLASNALAGSCSPCSIYVRNIDIEKVDSVNRDRLCSGDRFRVHADISIDGASSSIEVTLYVNGDYYDTETFYASDGSSREVIFDRIIDSGDFDCGSCSECSCSCASDPEIRVVAEACCGSGEATENIYFSSHCYDSYYLNDYGRLNVRVMDCKSNNPVSDATVEVSRGSYNVKTTNYDGYARFTLYPDTYTITASKNWYSDGIRDVHVYAGMNKEVTVCMGKDCREGYMSEMRCFGPYTQRKYMYSDCSEQWKLVDYCANGCLDGSCMPAASTTTTSTVPTQMSRPLFALEPTYEITACKVSNFTFNVVNLGPKRDFSFVVEGDGKDLVYVPSSLSLEAGEGKAVSAYAYMCEPGDYQFSVKAITGGLTSTSNSMLRVSTAQPLLSLLDSFLITFVVIIIVLVILKKLLPSAMGRIRSVERPEEFRMKGFKFNYKK
jgi:hypothetical protein